MKLLRDTWLIFQRQMLLLLRNPVWVIVGIVQPVFYLLLFAPLLKPALGVTSDSDAYRIFVPGLLVMLAFFSSFAGFGIIAELRAGIIERSRVTPVSRLALLLGRSMRDMVTLLIQAVIITVLAIPFGLSVGLGSVLLTYVVLSLMALMLSSVSYAAALKLRSEDTLAPLLNTLFQPILLTAGILLPLSLAPRWLQRVADWNPFSWAVDAARSLFDGHPGAASVWQALAILGGLTVLAMIWGARTFARSVR